MQLKPVLLFALIFGAIAFISFKSPFSRDDKNRIGKWYIKIPDSMPPYNGLYWANINGDTVDIKPYMSREYQVELDIDSTEIWDGDRLVGKIPYDSASKFDLLMTKDNE